MGRTVRNPRRTRRSTNENQRLSSCPFVFFVDEKAFHRDSCMKIAARMQRLTMESAFTVLAQVQALQAQGRDIVSLAIGDCDFETPERIREAGIAAIRAG